MPMPSDPQTAALLAHVLSQTQQNISFLASQGHISHADAADIQRRLAAAENNSSPVEASFRNMSLSPPVAEPAPAPAPPAPFQRNIPPPPARTQRARALWAYNEDGRESNDLSFGAGEIIDIVEETNADWWTGRVRGRQGLFPSNYVEKLSTAASPPPPAAPMPPMMPAAPMQPMPPPASYYSPPPEKSMYAPQYGGMPPPPPPAPVQMAPQTVVVEQAPPPEQPKKHRFGKLGSTMATSAAGGFGFGAGAAVGSDLINSIF
ncbi:hypothetical protein CERSUDRAFT_118000 [Gelatoporia subvermispora B]|uniref:SH3 domain-containing protein n=1 Tax=Ceriporiopsis subvermispora (strain B) TaxID=914234 RepID=M2R5F5_CERS8|nr:hypothetical protein CERSUDRAFT_118000 [Gelatoporia subvermispora B]